MAIFAYRMRFLLFVLFFLTTISINAHVATIRLNNHGIDNNPADSILFENKLTASMDSIMLAVVNRPGTYMVSDIQKPKVQHTMTSDFYLILSLCIILGLIRFIDPQYFYNLWRAFWNPILSNRQLKDQLQREQLPNFLMNTFFAFAEGAYIYYIVKLFTPYNTGNVSSSLLIIMLIAGTAVIYLSKYLSIKFCGWAFRVEGITDNYLFNVFLINKILAVILIPFIIVLAFADKSLSMNILILSFLLTGGMIANRYYRSWQALGSFFQYSKFHFFMYLCTSELLPLAVLIKLLVKGLMF